MSHSLFDLSGRTALVTGVASGIGRQTVHLLAELGAFVYATDIDHTGVLQTAKDVGSQAHALRHDVTAPADWAAVIEQVRSRSGRLDVLVNNAGIMLTAPSWIPAWTTFAGSKRLTSRTYSSA